MLKKIKELLLLHMVFYYGCTNCLTIQPIVKYLIEYVNPSCAVRQKTI